MQGVEMDETQTSDWQSQRWRRLGHPPGTQDFETATNTGFAFVNLTSRAAARRFFAHFHRFSRWGVRTRKLCNVSWAWDDQQGITANVERYRNRCFSVRFRPLLLPGHRGALR